MAPVLLAVVLCLLVSSVAVDAAAASLASSVAVAAAAASESVSRAAFPLDGEVAWVVQLSDLHLSAYHPGRARDLVRHFAPALRAIRPSLLLITGDITDAKNKRRTSSRQDESEWIQYRNTVDEVVRNSGIDKQRIFDIRGNHDKYGVPYVGDKLDFFSVYSVSSQLNRFSTIQSISLVGSERIYVFVGIDDTISIGIRGPSNLFGHPTERRIEAVESELMYWNNHSSLLVTKVVFGHFPMSFTASSEKGERYESLFARQSVSAYICGHLHATFGKQLWRLHTVEVASNPNEPKKEKQFWEWEVGDWKESRLLRILAIDGGQVSFLDFKLPTKQKSRKDFQTTILITHPTDSRSMNSIGANRQSLRNDINALVFSVQPIANATALVFDSSRAFRIVEEVPLQVVDAHKPLFHAKWNAENYRSASAARYWLQVFVLDSQGKKTASTMRPFSVDNKLASCSRMWLAYLVLDVLWEDLYAVLFWTNVGFLIVLLFLPKLLNYFMAGNAPYQKWAMSVSISSPIRKRKLSFWVLRYLIEGSRRRKYWFSMLFYFIYLLIFPWFWGRATSEDGDIARMYIFGWSIQAQNSKIYRDNLASPDIMAITLPFMYLVVTPMFLLIYSLFAEWSMACLHSSEKTCLNKPIFLKTDLRHEFDGGVTSGSSRGMVKYWVQNLCRRRARKVLLLACFVVAFVHFKLCSSLMAAYGAGAVALSPALTWVPVLFIAAAIYSTTANIQL